MVVTFAYNLRKKIKDKHRELKDRDTAKARADKEEAFKKWEHDASLNIIVRIKNACNLYKDRSGADRVMFSQLENGTLATSKLCNMFISCLAEDSRFGNLPKDIRKLQRIPYSYISDWIDQLKSLAEDDDRACLKLTGDDHLLEVMNTLYTTHVGSQLSIVVYDHNRVFIGICVMEYAGPNFNDVNIVRDIGTLNDFKAAVESILHDYYVMRERQKVVYELSPQEREEVDSK